MQYRLLRGMHRCDTGTLSYYFNPVHDSNIVFPKDVTNMEYGKIAYVFSPKEIKEGLGTWFEEVKPERWKAEIGESYFLIDDHGTIQKDCARIGYLNHFNNCNAWRTADQAREAARRCLEVRKKYSEELANAES